MYYFIHFQWSVSVSSGHNAREYYQYLYLTFLVQTGLDQGDGELSLSEEREVALQHQHKLLRVPLLECQQQILKTKKTVFFFPDLLYIYLLCYLFVRILQSNINFSMNFVIPRNADLANSLDIT